MFSDRTFKIFMKEIREKLMSPSFMIMTLILPLIVFVLIFFQKWMMESDSGKDTKLLIVTDREYMSQGLENVTRAFLSQKDAPNIEFEIILNKDFKEDELVKKYQDDIADNVYTGMLFVGEDAFQKKEIRYYSTTPKNENLFMKLNPLFNQLLIQYYFKDKDVTPEDISYARIGVRFESYRISKEEEAQKEGYGNMIASYIFVFLLYFSLIFMGSQMSQGVIEEKSNRISEILLSSVDSIHLITGKILGISLTGLVQMIIWLSPAVVLIFTNFISLPPGFELSMTPWQLVFFLMNYFIGLIAFMSLFAGMGSLFDNPQDASSGMWPIMMMIIIPFFIAMSMQMNPDSMAASVASLIPFASVIVMPPRTTLTSVPVWQVVFAFSGNLIAMFVSFHLAAKIYQTGILRTGKAPKFKEILKLIQTKA